MLEMRVTVACEEFLLYPGLAMRACGAKRRERRGLEDGAYKSPVSLVCHEGRNRDVAGYEVGYVVTPKSVKAAAPKGRMAALVGSPCSVYSTNAEETRGLAETGNQKVGCWLAVHHDVGRKRGGNSITAFQMQ
jgi:hypothetical protein